MVRKVQSTAYVKLGPTEVSREANKLAPNQRINQNSGQLQHVPRIANQGHGSSNSFKLTKEAYQKLTANYNYSKFDGADRQKSLVYATQDMRMQNAGTQRRFGKSFVCGISTPILVANSL